MGDTINENDHKVVSYENGMVPVSQYIEDVKDCNEKDPMLSKEIEMQEIKNQKNIVEKTALKRMLTHDLEVRFKDEPLTEETTCGYWIFRGSFFQKFANKKAYVLLYGLSGCIFSATYAYFNATITTLEKRYKIPSRTVGFIGVGNDISSLFLSAALSYYAGKGHRPRWVAFGILTISIFCILTSLPHFIYGPGEEAVLLTTEFGARFDDDTTFEIMEKEKTKTLCQTNNSTIAKCEISEGSLAPQAILFVAQLIAGIGGSLYYTLGASYMDDNIQKSKTPALISFSYFLRTLGPAFGYTIASFCLKVYISPDLTPTINIEDPRWLGAWWMGWLFLGVVLAFCSLLLSLFPHTLPRAAIRRKIREERKRLGEKVDEPIVEKPSFRDMMITFKRLLKNKILMFNHFASVFYFFGYMPYWIFTPKYIETQYKQSASISSLVTGTVALAFSAIGILASGLVISKFKPRARYLAAWNVLVGLFSVAGIIGYIFLGCKANENSIVVNQALPGDVTCNSNCHCDYVKYSPVCGENGQTYISPCHAGCKSQTQDGNRKIYTECTCISPIVAIEKSNAMMFNDSWEFEDDYDLTTTTDIPIAAALSSDISSEGIAIPNACPINCQYQFILFLIVMCFIKFTGATGRASNFLVGVRCVDEKDKTASMGFGLMIMALFAFIPSPIFFGGLMDKYCILWGKTCSGKGNCWLYDNESLRIWLNLIAACFVAIGTLLDAGVWYYAKDLKIFDEEIHEDEKEIAEREEEVTHDRV